MLKSPERPARNVDNQTEEWTAELVELRGDPTVRKYLELRDRMDRTAAIVAGAGPPPVTDRFWPYGLYDAFEFARDLSGRQLSTEALSRLAFRRFPDLSRAEQQVMVDFLIDKGLAKVDRTTETGRPASYRFEPLGERRSSRKGTGLGMPENELSEFKAEDLEDVIGLATAEPERL